MVSTPVDLHKLGKANSQSMDPMLQLAKVQHIWDMAVQLGQPHTMKEGAAQVKPLSSIMTSCHLAGLTDDEKLLTALYNGNLTVSELECHAHQLKVHKQVKQLLPVTPTGPLSSASQPSAKSASTQRSAYGSHCLRRLGRAKPIGPTTSLYTSKSYSLRWKAMAWGQQGMGTRSPSQLISFSSHSSSSIISTSMPAWSS